MVLSDIIKQLLEKRFNNEIRYPVDCESLSEDIFIVTKSRVSSSTLKRLLGFVRGTEEARLSTLDIIAEYLSFKNWNDLIINLNDSGNSDFFNLDVIKSDELEIGCEIELKYDPNRVLCLKYIGNYNFEIFKSENSKLKTNDLLSIYYIVKNQPLYIRKVIRENRDIGEYNAGLLGGITSVTMIKK